MTASTIPAVLAALMSIGNGLSGVVTSLGPGDTDSGSQQMLWIGVDDSISSAAEPGPMTAVDGTWTWPWLGRLQRDERYTVGCAAVGWDGTNDPTASIASAFAVLTAFTTAFVADATLGGVVMQVNGGDITLRLDSDDNGVIAYLNFALEFQARLS